uniref:DUF4124 domain-containing protein n=1 Tax=Parastrongyloides trichosuri TaxID=131310 RepID=A0A0N4ZJS6_PARTI
MHLAYVATMPSAEHPAPDPYRYDCPWTNPPPDVRTDRSQRPGTASLRGFGC